MLNICQVSLARDIPIILENFYSFKKIYKSFRIFIICPANEIGVFKKKLHYKEFKFINENDLISIQEFKAIYENLRDLNKHQELLKNRLSWYYQQVLKLSFILHFVEYNRENIVIWDADTLILKKIEFFKKKILFHMELILNSISIILKQIIVSLENFQNILFLH